MRRFLSKITNVCSQPSLNRLNCKDKLGLERIISAYARIMPARAVNAISREEKTKMGDFPSPQFVLSSIFV